MIRTGLRSERKRLDMADGPAAMRVCGIFALRSCGCGFSPAPQNCREVIELWNDSRATKVKMNRAVPVGVSGMLAGSFGSGDPARQLFLTTELCEFAIRLAAVHKPRLILANKKG